MIYQIKGSFVLQGYTNMCNALCHEGNMYDR